MSEKKVETNCLSYQEKKNLIGFAKTLCTTENISNWKLLKKKEKRFTLNIGEKFKNATSFLEQACWLLQ